MNTNVAKRGRPKKIDVKLGDWLRVRIGPLQGAEGSVEKIETKQVRTNKKLVLVEIRQLNGNPIRLPRHHFEFSALRPKY